MLRKPKSGVAAPARSEHARRSDNIVARLIRQNDDLEEEIRQMRAAIALWAKVAASTCSRCIHRPESGVLPACESRGCDQDLIQLAHALLSISIHAVDELAADGK